VLVKSRHVVIVDPHSSGNLLPPAFHERGFPPIGVLSTSTPPEIFAPSLRTDHLVSTLVNTGDPEALVERLRPFAPVAIVPGAETAVELADLLAAELTPHRANHPDLRMARRHKGMMTRAVAGAGLATIRTTCASSAEDIAVWIAAERLSGKDLVLKPPRSGGGNGLAVVRGGDGWLAAFEKLMTTPDYYRNVNREVVVQEFVGGVEYAVDTVSADGRHTVSAIYRYGKTDNGVHAAVYESLEFLPYTNPGHREILDYTFAVLDALGIRHGAAHTEVMVTSDGIRLIETGARLAGGGLPDVCAFATGESPVDRLVSFVAGDVVRDDYSLRIPVMLAFFVLREEGIVSNVEVLEQVRTLPSFCGMNLPLVNGQQVARTDDMLATMRTGWVVLANPDRLALHADYSAVREIEAQLVVIPAVQPNDSGS
jgi:predicted ATP-grasp superfamily ATP-dependent carboligase